MNPLNLLKKKEKPPVCSVVIVAAGSSQRMGGDKLTMKLGEAPVLGRTILAFAAAPRGWNPLWPGFPLCAMGLSISPSMTVPAPS